MFSIEEEIKTRRGVLMYPNEAAAAIAADPPEDNTDPIITNEILSTRAGCLRFPSQAASYIAAMDISSSSSSS